MTLQDEADQLAGELFATRSKLRAAGRTLHDQVGPLLSAAGIRMGLLRTDHPQAASEIEPALMALEEAMDRVRTLSRDLNPPPGAHLGLKKALLSLAQGHAETFKGSVHFTYTASVEPPDDACAAIYEAAGALMERAVADRSATRIAISVSGARKLTVKIQSNGRVRWSASLLAGLERRGRPAGIVLEALTKQGTIVSIHYAVRRPPRG
jgi:signal transduction histidine kinase